MSPRSNKVMKLKLHLPIGQAVNHILLAQSIFYLSLPGQVDLYKHVILDRDVSRAILEPVYRFGRPNSGAPKNNFLQNANLSAQNARNLLSDTWFIKISEGSCPQTPLSCYKPSASARSGPQQTVFGVPKKCLDMSLLEYAVQVNLHNNEYLMPFYTYLQRSKMDSEGQGRAKITCFL